MREKSLPHRTLTALIAPGAVLYGIDLEGASLQGSNLAGCDLRAARFAGADLRGVNLSGAKLNHADLRNAKLGPLLIAAERLLPARLDNVEARYADFRGADLRRVRMTGSDLAYANLIDADLRDADMTDVDLPGPNCRCNSRKPLRLDRPSPYAPRVRLRADRCRAPTLQARRAHGNISARPGPSFLPRVRRTSGGRCALAGLPAWRTDWGKKLGRFRAYDGLELRRIDHDSPRLLGLRHDALEIDVKQTVLKLGAFDLDMFGQLEFALEGAAGDALMKISGLAGLFALAGDGQDAVSNFDAEILFGKSRGCDRNAVIILVAALDIVGRIALSGVGAFEQIEQTIEADGGTEERRIIQTHNTTS